jgi:hypothetical protein
MRQIAFSLVASFLTAAYWWIVFTLVYADVLFAGERNPALPLPPERDVLVHNVATIVTGVLLYAISTLLWHRATIRWRT